MLMTFTKFPSIEQLRGVVQNIKYYYEDHDMPTIDFTGTVKLHGTNASVGWDGKELELQIQSRNRIITATDDNAGFAKYVIKNQQYFKTLLQGVRDAHPVPDQVGQDGGPDPMLFVYGEWCGKGIQTGVAISEVEPMFVIFAVAYRIDDETLWIPHNNIPSIIDARIFNIMQFENYKMSITFTPEGLEQAQDKLEQLTNQVESECPVGKHFGHSGVGEGIVWIGTFTGPHDGKIHNLRFKVKGEKHAVVKSKKAVPIDTEKLKGIQSFIEYAVTDNRLNQGYDELFTKPGKVATQRDIGTFIKWVRDDVVKEESDTMDSNGLDIKDINKAVSTAARVWFMRKM